MIAYVSPGDNPVGAARTIRRRVDSDLLTVPFGAGSDIRRGCDDDVAPRAGIVLLRRADRSSNVAGLLVHGQADAAADRACKFTFGLGTPSSLDCECQQDVATYILPKSGG